MTSLRDVPTLSFKPKQVQRRMQATFAKHRRSVTDPISEQEKRAIIRNFVEARLGSIPSKSNSKN